MTYPQYVVTLLLCLIAFVGYAMLLQDNLKEMNIRSLILYLRQVFCRHDWERSENQVQNWGYNRTTEKEYVTRVGPQISLLCLKCGYHKAFWKYK